MRIRRKKLYWILGASVALFGVGVARMAAPSLPEAYQSAGFLVGLTIAIFGIFISALGAGAGTTAHAPADKAQEEDTQQR